MSDSAMKMLDADPLISVVVVTWNAKEYAYACLESLQSACGDSRLEIIVVDNASSDGTPDLIAQHFPQVKLIRNTGNYGFAKANNIGIRESTGDYVCLVNSDVRFTSNCFKPMLRYLQDHPDIGLLGPQAKNSNGITTRSTMRFPTVWNCFMRALGLDVLFRRSPILRSQLMMDFDHATTCDVEVINGWFWMVSRHALEKVGLLDERFFIYGEDIDWCIRFHKAGMRVVFFVEAEAIHYGGASSEAAPMRFSVELVRATWQYYQKHYSVAQRVALFIAGVLHYGIRGAGYGLLAMLVKNRDAAVVWKFQRCSACLTWLLQNPVILHDDFQDNRSNQKGAGQEERARAKPAAWHRFVQKAIKFFKRCVKLLLSLVYYCEQWLWRRWQQLRGKELPGTCVALYYHSVNAQDRANFARQMAILSRFAKPIRADHQDRLENAVHHAVVCFHDGFECVCENAIPELAKRKIPAILFVPSGYVGRPPGWEMEEGHPDSVQVVVSVARLKSLNTELCTIGSHTVTHPDLPSLRPEEAIAELRKSRLDLEALLERPVELFAFPYGRQNTSLLKWCKEVGYQRVFTTEPRLAFTEPGEFVTGSFGVSPNDWPLEFTLKLLGAYQWLYQLKKNRGYDGYSSN